MDAWELQYLNCHNSVLPGTAARLLGITRAEFDDLVSTGEITTHTKPGRRVCKPHSIGYVTERVLLTDIASRLGVDRIVYRQSKYVAV